MKTRGLVLLSLPIGKVTRVLGASRAGVGGAVAASRLAALGGSLPQLILVPEFPSVRRAWL